MTISEALRQTNIAPLDARLLLQHVLHCSHEALLLRLHDALEENELQAFEMLCARRTSGEPVAKIIGQKAFWSHQFITTQDTLDPRPESEQLVDLALQHAASQAHTGTVLDIGTGTGCLLLSCLSELPDAWQGVGLDISAAAIKVAQQNAAVLDLHARTEWMECDIAAYEPCQYFDIILCNPPYIPEDEILPKEVLHDPESALFAGKDGLDIYRLLPAMLPRMLAPHGVLLLEHGTGQSAAIAALFSDYETKRFYDLAGHDRCLQVAFS